MLIAKLWGGITDDQFDLLKEHLEIKKYKKNEIIYKNEGTPEYALCLIAGKVKIYKEGIGGKSQIIRVIKPIEFFGFRAYFADEIYKTAAMSLENCVVAQFPLAVLMKLISKSFNIDARIVGRIEEGERSLTIKSEFGEFHYPGK